MRCTGVTGRVGRGGPTMAAVLLAWAIAAPGIALAAKWEGEVVEVQAQDQSFAVREGSGAGIKAPIKIFRTDPDTRITFETKVVPFGNLVPGDQVSVHYRNQDPGPLATAVEIHRLHKAH
jgi:hypothetical protein